jgi:hypothetical protein
VSEQSSSEVQLNISWNITYFKDLSMNVVLKTYMEHSRTYIPFMKQVNFQSVQVVHCSYFQSSLVYTHKTQCCAVTISIYTEPTYVM